MLKPAGLTHGHYECRSLEQTLPVLTGLLAMQVVERRDKEALVKHPNTDWHLVVREAGAEAGDKPHNNHYGVRVARGEEIDAAHRYLVANKARYGLTRVSPPRVQHYARSVYFGEPGGNTLEIEYYEPQAAAEGRTIARPHWNRELSEAEFPGRGYVPQALTHGTLECNDKDAAAAFYRDVLGLEIAGGGRISVYIKHPATPWYIVVLPIKKRRKFLTPANRLTLTMASPGEVERAHRELSRLPSTETRPVESRDGHSSFIFADPDRNWWEVTA
jgi:catechol 2,3-dioxygenase-like lactoylglutathione lyase family enzyme